jgi:hypothetical protein
MLFIKKAKHWTVTILKGSQGQNSMKNSTWSLLNLILIYLFITGVTIHADNYGCHNYSEKKLVGFMDKSWRG